MCNYRSYLVMAKVSLIFAIVCLCTITCRATECTKECETSQTCCPSSVAGDFRCCPLPNAVCCADGENCCPENSLCDSSSGGCVPQSTHSQEFHDRKGLQHLIDDTQPAVDHQEEKSSDVVFCPDFSVCPEYSTCCLRPDSTYGCCPYVSAVCCSDYEHCCPSGESCDWESMTCNGKYSQPIDMRWPALPLE